MGGGRDKSGAAIYKKTKQGYIRIAEYKDPKKLQKDFEEAKENWVSIYPVGDNTWEGHDSSDEDVTYIAFTENGNRAYEMDENGNRIRPVNPDDYPNAGRDDGQRDIGDMSLKEAKERLERKRELLQEEQDRLAEENRRFEWWDTGGKERTLYGL